MARIDHIFCPSCQQTKEIIVGGLDGAPRVCHVCADTAATKERADHLAKLRRLPLEERIARIEAALYDARGATAASIRDMLF